MAKDSKTRYSNYKSAALNQLSYAGKNTAHINGLCRVKQVADRVVLVTWGAKMAQSVRKSGLQKFIADNLSKAGWLRLDIGRRRSRTNNLRC
jgi:hypothetical protein